MMKKATLILYSCIFIFFSCGVPQEEYDKLKKENESLKQEIADCQLTPVQILEQANEYNDNLEYEKSKSRLIALIEKYPKSTEARKAKRLLKKVEKEIEETKKALERDKLTENNNENFKKAIGKMKKKYDVSNSVTWYSDKSSTLSGTKNFLHTYIGKKEKRKPWMGISVNHFSKEEWLFIKQIVITADGKTYTIEEENPGEFKASETEGGMREWFDRVLKEKDFEMIKQVAESKSAKLQLIGKTTTKERTISLAEKKAIKNVLNAFEALGGSLK